MIGKAIADSTFCYGEQTCIEYHLPVARLSTFGLAFNSGGVENRGVLVDKPT